MVILSVDDSGATRMFARSAVEVMGHEFAEAENGKAAQRLLEQGGRKIDLILLDWNMPVMDGITFLKWLKADPRFSGIPVTMVTTEVERVKVIEAIGAGAKNYLMKPFTQEELVGKIMESLGMGV
jgi:two-component system chemotaxis response regulator CheY